MIAATGWGAALAALQLGLSWQFADSVRQTGRGARELLFYSFPPSHWFELVLPRLIRELRLGPEDPYWFGQQTSGYEAALYVGTIPLIFAVIGALRRPASRSAALWRILVPVSFALATMPRWWPDGLSPTRRTAGNRLFPSARAVYSAHEPGRGHSGRRGIRSFDLEGGRFASAWRPLWQWARAEWPRQCSGPTGRTCNFWLPGAE